MAVFKTAMARPRKSVLDIVRVEVGEVFGPLDVVLSALAEFLRRDVVGRLLQRCLMASALKVVFRPRVAFRRLFCRLGGREVRLFAFSFQLSSGLSGTCTVLIAVYRVCSLVYKKIFKA